MPFLFEQIAREARARYVELGRQFGYSDALAQADQTLQAFERFGSQIAGHGFIALDADRLQEAKLMLAKEAGPENDCGTSEKRTSREYVAAILAGKAARQRARSILFIVAQRLVYTGDLIASEAARAVVSAIQQTESSRGDPLRLAAQLDQLRATLSIPRVDKEVERRGGPETADALVAVANRLRSVTMDSDPAITDATENADLLCGMIVEIVRDARRAARSAAREHAQPIFASAFALSKLYGPVGGSGTESERFPSLK